MMRANAGFHPDQARWHVGKAGLDLATRPFLTQRNGTTLIVVYDVERVLADIDTNHGKCSDQSGTWRAPCLDAPSQLLLLAGREHDRTIPLTDILAG
jgi:hypothetical protein